MTPRPLCGKARDETAPLTGDANKDEPVWVPVAGGGACSWLQHDAACPTHGPGAEGPTGPRGGTSLAFATAAPHYTPRPRELAAHRDLFPQGPRGLEGELVPQEAAWGTSEDTSAQRSGAPAGEGSPLNPDPQELTEHPHPAGHHSLSDELDGVLILHPTLDESQCHEDRSPGGGQGAGRPSRCTPPLPRPAAC